MAASAARHIGGALAKPLRPLLGTEPLTAAELLGCALVAAVAGVTGVALRVWRWLRRDRSVT